MQFLLSKFWAKVSSKKLEAAACNNGSTVFHLGIHISFALKLGIGIHIFLLWNEYILFKGSYQIFDAFSR